MDETRLEEPGLDYVTCRYGRSRLLFRGPKANLSVPYAAFLGSTETFGKFVEEPFPELVGQSLNVNTVNLGCVNAGIDAFHDDTSVVDLCRGAEVCVLQAMPAHSLSNRIYSVHPRRNDRFVSASNLLGALYPEVDLTDVHFTRHLLSVLREASEDRFQIVIEELASAWLSRMTRLLSRIHVPTILMYLTERQGDPQDDTAAGNDPLYITRDMLEEIRPRLAGLVEVTMPPPRGDQPHAGMVFAPNEIAAARELPGPATHSLIADRLVPAIADHWNPRSSEEASTGHDGNGEEAPRASAGGKDPAHVTSASLQQAAASPPARQMPADQPGARLAAKKSAPSPTASRSNPGQL